MHLAIGSKHDNGKSILTGVGIISKWGIDKCLYDDDDEEEEDSNTHPKFNPIDRELGD